MIAKDKIIAVQNRGQGRVGYTIPDLNNLHRDYQPNELKNIPFEELFMLSQVPGGNYIIENYLIIKDEEAIQELLGQVEPEYNYTDEDVRRLMISGSLDEFEDLLNFAPAGVIELIKTLSVSLPLNDIGKRDLILKKTGFSVTNAIINAKAAEEEDAEQHKPTRKASIPTTTTQGPVRKVVQSSTK